LGLFSKIFWFLQFFLFSNFLFFKNNRLYNQRAIDQLALLSSMAQNSKNKHTPRIAPKRWETVAEKKDAQWRRRRRRRRQCHICNL